MVCRVCGGTGYVDEECEYCFGTGRDPDELDENCIYCFGSGYFEVKCEECSEEG